MSAANCSFCSKPNESIQVLCDSRCLLCARCLQAGPVQELLLNCAEHATKACPLCEAPMAPNMIKLITSSFSTEDIAHKASNFVEFGESPNPWSTFLKRFRNTYIDKADATTESAGKLPGHHHHHSHHSHHHHVGGQYSPENGSRPGSPNPAAAGIPTLTNPGGMFSDDSEALAAATSGSRPGTGTNSRSKPNTGQSAAGALSPSKPGSANVNPSSKPSTAVGPLSALTGTTPQQTNSNNSTVVLTSGLSTVKFSTQQIIELTCDIFLLMWQDIHKNEFDSVINLTMKVVCKRKGNQKTMDMRVKAFLDSIRSQNCLEHPYLFLFGLINGLLPRRTENIRPMLGFVANYFIILGYADCEGKNTRYKEEMAVPEALRVVPVTLLTYCINEADLNSNNIRARFKKHYLPKLKGVAADGVISVRKAIVMIDYVLNKLQEPHFVMSGLQGACVEYSSRMPWCKGSILRLFDALFELVTACYAQKPAASTNHHSTGVSSLMQPTFVPKSHAAVPIDYDSMSLRAFQCVNAVVASKWAVGTHVPGDDPQLNVFELSALFESKMKQGEGKVIGISVFAAFMMYAWEQEYLYIKSLLERRAGVSGRREAMTSHYDRTNAESAGHKLSVSERAIMNKIIDYFDAIGAPGIDWVSLKTPEGRNRVPFAIPDKLINRPHIELNYCALALMESKKRLDFQSHLEQMQDDFLTYPQEESLNHFEQLALYEQRDGSGNAGVTAGSISERIEEVQRMARAKYLAEQQIDTGAPQSLRQMGSMGNVSGEHDDVGSISDSVARGLANAEAAVGETHGEEFFNDLLVQVGGESKGGRLALSVVKTNTNNCMTRAFSDDKLLNTDKSSVSGLPLGHHDVPPTLHDFMNSDKYIKESTTLRNSVPTMSCYAGELTINGVRKDHMSPGVAPSASLMMVGLARKNRDTNTADTLASCNQEAAVEEAEEHIRQTEKWVHHQSTAQFKPIPTAYESPAPSRKHRVSMIDTLSVAPAVLEKIKLVHPLDGQYPTDTEKFGFLKKGIELEPRPPSQLLSNLGLDNMVLGKGNSNASTAAASEFLELITNPKNQVARSKEFATSALILEAVNRASAAGTYLGVPNSPYPIKNKIQHFPTAADSAGAGAGAGAGASHGNEPEYIQVDLEERADKHRRMRSSLIFNNSRGFKDEELSELSCGEGEFHQEGGAGGLSLHQLTITDFRNAGSAIPTRDPVRIRDRINNTTSCPILPTINTPMKGQCNTPGGGKGSPMRSRGSAPRLGVEEEDKDERVESKNESKNESNRNNNNMLKLECAEDDDDEANEYSNSSASVLFRSLEPAGAHDRRILTLSHISSLRESEYPRLNLEYFQNPVQLDTPSRGRVTSSGGTKGAIFATKEVLAERAAKEAAAKLERLEESAPKLKAFVIRDAKIDKTTLAKVIDLYLCSPYLRHMSRIDLSGNCLGTPAMEMLAEAFATHGCGKLKTLSLGGNIIKNKGLKTLLTKGLMPGGCCEVTPRNANMSTPFHGIMKLDLRHCGLSLSEPFEKDTFAGFSTLTNLRVLDMSWNQLTADTKAQKAVLKTLFNPLVKLEILSVAFNRLGDEGGNLLMESILMKNNSIRVLDLSHCFLSNPSLKGVNKLLSGNTAVPEKKKRGAPVTAEEPIPTYNAKSASQLKVLILQGNTFKVDSIAQVRKFAVTCDKKVIVDGVHVGIDLPVRYESLYDIDVLDKGDAKKKIHERYQSLSRTASTNTLPIGLSRPTSATNLIPQTPAEVMLKSTSVKA